MRVSKPLLLFSSSPLLLFSSSPLLLFSSSPLLLISSSSSTASSRSQWALPGLNCEFQSSVGTAGTTASSRATAVGAAGFQPRAPNLSGHCQTSTASARSIIVRTSLHFCTTERRAIAWEKPFKHHVRHAVQTTA